MKKLLFTFFLLLGSYITLAQIEANDDVGGQVNGFTGGVAFTNVLSNDTLDGNPANLSSVTLSFLSSTNPNITLNLGGGNVIVSPGTPAGNYVLTYQICDNANSSNCDTATVTVDVYPAVINAVNDSGSPTPSSGGIAFTNVLVNDTFNGAPVVASQIAITMVTSTSPGVTLSGTSVVVASGTPSGNYTLTYQICELLNPTNCDVAIVSVPVSPGANVINAVNDSMPITNGLVGNSNIGNVFYNNGSGPDTINGTPLTNFSLVTMTVQSPATPILVGSPVPTLDVATGIISVPAGTPVGVYTIVYQICDIANSTNCDTATVFITIASAIIDARDDLMHVSNGVVGNNNVGNVLANNGSGADTFDANPLLDLTSITMSVLTAATPVSVGASVPVLNTSTGQIAVPAGTPTGLYTITYQICEIANPSNCDAAIVTVTVGAPLIDAVKDTITHSTAITGNTIIGNVLDNNGFGPDTLGGNPVALNQVTLTVISPATPIATGANVPTLDPLTGIISASGSIPNGTYYIMYIICDVTNPNNCDSDMVTIVITGNPLNINLVGTYSDYNNDGFVNVGDVINYQITLTNNGATAMTNLTACQQSMNINGGTLTSLPQATSNSTFFTGMHAITQAEINANAVVGSVCFCGSPDVQNCISNIITTLAIPNLMKLQAFIDSNANGTKDSNENFFNQGKFSYSINGGGTAHLYTGGTAFLYESNPSTTYNLSFTPYNTSFYSCNTTYNNVTVPTGSGMTTYNFPVTILNPQTDLAVYIWPSVGPRPGFTYGNLICLFNAGNQTIAAGTLTFTKDNALTITSLPSGATATATGFTYNFTNLLPFEYRFVNVPLQVPTIPTVSIGQYVTNSATVSIPPGDIYTNNNTFNLIQDIRSSYDPNDKQENHGGRILFDDFTADDYLTYTIRFENTGTAEAINIRVEDVLDNQLDENSLRMVTASHDYVLERVGNNLTWRFDGVNLLPSVPDTQIGHGFITFQIKPKIGYAIGDIIPNTAEIYFDFNPAIVTNTCTTEFVETLGSDNFVFSSLYYFPNPVKNSLTISNTSVIDSVEITSILGQQMLSQKVNSLQTEVDLSEFSNGIYFVKVTSEGKEKTIKIIKE